MSDRVERLRELLPSWLAPRLGELPAIREVAAPGGTGFSGSTLLVDLDLPSGKPRAVVLRFESAPEASLFRDPQISLPWRMIVSLAAHTDVPVPEPIGVEFDATFLGAPFMVTGRVRGQPASQVPNYNLSGWLFDLEPPERRRAWENAIEAMVRIHNVDWRRGFEFLGDETRGRPGLDHCLADLDAWYAWASRGRPQALLDLGLDYLRANQPRDSPVGVVWGDAAPNNMLFDDDLSIGAILDWEIAALGPGEMDLAWWLFFDEYLSSAFGIARLEGFPNREQTIAIYQGFLGRDVQNLEYYEVLAHTRNAVMAMRSVNRQVEFGRIPEDTSAVINNPIARMLARKLGQPLPEVGEDYSRYLAAAIREKRPSKKSDVELSPLKLMSP